MSGLLVNAARHVGPKPVVLVTAILAALCLALPGAAGARALDAAHPNLLTTDAPTANTDLPTIVDATHATLRGDIEPNFLDTTYYFEWAAADNVICDNGGSDVTPPHQTTQSQVTASNSYAYVSASIPQSGDPALVAGQSYCYKLVASNTDGPGEGIPITFVSGAPSATASYATVTGPQTADISYTGNAAGQSAQVSVQYDDVDNADQWCQNLFETGMFAGNPAHQTAPQSFGFSDDQDHDATLHLSSLTPGTTYCAVVSISNGSVPGGVADPTYVAEFTAGAPTVSTESVVSTSATGASVTADINPNGQTGVTYVAEWDALGSAFCDDTQDNTPTITGGTTTPATMASSAEATVTVNFTVAHAGSSYCVLVVATAGTVKDTSDVNYFDSDVQWTAGVPLATTDSGAGTGPTSGQISGTVNPAGQTTQYFAAYWLNTPDGCPDPPTDPTGTTTPVTLAGTPDATDHQVTVTITGLTQNTDYCAEVRATNGSGSSEASINNYNSPTEFSTGAPAVTTDDADPVGATTATIDGTVNPEGDNTTTYWVDYNVSTSPFCTSQDTTDATIHQTTHTGTSTAGSVLVNLTSLTPGTTYCAEVVAHNASGTTYGTPAVTFTPLALPFVDARSATAQDPTSEVLTGSVNPDGQPTTYQFAYALANSAWCTSTPHSGAGVVYSPATAASAGTGSTDVPETATLSGLAPGNEYCWAITASNASGPAISDGGNFKVGRPVATTASATAVGATTATLNGTVNPENYSTEFNFDYAPASSPWCTSGGASGQPTATAETAVGTVDTNPHSVSVALGSGANPALASGTMYCFQVLASNGAGNTHGAMLTFTTTGSGPNSPHSLAVQMTGTGSGSVTGNQNTGISCPGACSASTVPGGTQITLTEIAAAGSTFGGWSGGGCSGTSATCVVTLSSDTTVTATFTKNAPPPPPKPTCSLTATSLKVLLKKSKTSKVKPGTITLSAQCDQAANGTIAVKLVGSVKQRTKKTTKTISFTTQVSVSAGQATAVVVKLPGGARMLLKKKVKLASTFTLTVRNANGTATATKTGIVTGS
jgi:hypothetical protein